jgi:serine/threonine kinase 32
MIVSKRPYIAQSKENLADAIIHDPLEFPNNVYEIVSKECIDVICGVSLNISFRFFFFFFFAN